MIYFDNAATTGKKPYSVKKAVEFTLNNLCANPGRSGHFPAEKAAEALYSVRKKISGFFGAEGPQNVIFCSNCTEALNFVIKGVLKENDLVTVSDLEHNAVMRPLFKSGIKYKKAKVSFYDDAETAKAFKNSLSSDTKMVICTAASNVTGKILPLEEIGKICKERGILFAVDGAQGVGIMPIDMKKMNIDYLCVAGHKGLYAPMGSGVLISNGKIENTLIEGGNGLDSLNLVQTPDKPEGFESGTVNLPSVMGIGGGIDFLNHTGMRNIYQKELKIIQNIYKELEKNEKIILYTPFPEIDKFVPVLSFNISGYSSEETTSALNDYGIAVRGGFHCSASAHQRLGTLDYGAVRISTGYFNNDLEGRQFINILKKL